MGARWSAEGSVDGMDPTYSEQADAFRRRIREFLDQNLPDGWSGIGALSIEEATEEKGAKEDVQPRGHSQENRNVSLAATSHSYDSARSFL